LSPCCDWAIVNTLEFLTLASHISEKVLKTIDEMPQQQQQQQHIYQHLELAHAVLYQF
jgi:hypothetical protein